jgi:hypothetical protein
MCPSFVTLRSGGRHATKWLYELWTMNRSIACSKRSPAQHLLDLLESIWRGRLDRFEQLLDDDAAIADHDRPTPETEQPEP